MGDKKSEFTAQYYSTRKATFLKTQKILQEIFSNGVKTLVVVRDPFNTILRKCKLTSEKSDSATVSARRKTYWVLNQKILESIPGDVNSRMTDYFRWMTSVDEILNNTLFNVKLIQLEEMFKNPEPIVKEWCQWLNIECFPEYVSLIKNTTKSSGKTNKMDYFWPESVIETINQFVDSYSHLYSKRGAGFKLDPRVFQSAVFVRQKQDKQRD